MEPTLDESIHVTLASPAFTTVALNLTVCEGVRNAIPGVTVRSTCCGTISIALILGKLVTGWNWMVIWALVTVTGIMRSTGVLEAPACASTSKLVSAAAPLISTLATRLPVSAK